MRLSVMVMGLAVLVGLGCVGTDAPGPVSEVAEAVTSGPVPQGTKMQGTKMQGTKMQGTKMQGTKMQGTKMQGTHLEGTTLVGQALVLPASDPSLAPCDPAASGLGRDCGWQIGGIGTCQPGTGVTVGASAACGLGSCAGDSLLRVCTGQAACGPGSAGEIASNDNACGGTCSSVTFVCPASGAYTVLTGNQSSASSDDIAPAASTGSFPLTVPVAGAGFIGATLEGIDQNGAAFDILIADIQPDPGDPSGEILLYTLLAKDTDGSMQNLCETDADGVAAATFLAGTWNDAGARSDASGLVTIGCTVGVLTKCVRWGYKPWKTVNGFALADYHQACTRMARADYCGDGTPHTRDGTLIDIWDNVPIQARDSVLGMLYEASWTTAGAYCVSKGRWNLDGATIALECPARVALPSLTDILNGCLMKLTTADRSAIRTNDLSYLEVFIPL